MDEQKEHKDYKDQKQHKEWSDHVLSLMKTGLKFQVNLLECVLKELNMMPKGSICKKVIRGTTYFYVSTKDKSGNQIQRILKSNDDSLKQILMTKYCFKKCLNYLQKNIPLMKRFVQMYRPIFADVDQKIISVMPNLMFDHNDKIEKWKNESFKSNPSFKEGLIHTTTLGGRVRSKSEAVIASLFEVNGIAFRYEAELFLGGKVYYPDFMILRPLSGKVLYWEHFGMLNDSKYHASAVKKLCTYFENGLYPYDNFIITYDREDGSIDASNIQSLIDQIALS